MNEDIYIVVIVNVEINYKRCNRYAQDARIDS